MSSGYQLNVPAVVAEEVDGEIIAINMASGVYFSMTGWSAWAWNALTAGFLPSQIADELSGLIDANTEPQPHELAQQVDAFVADLCADRLLVARAHQAPPPDGWGPAPALAFSGLSAERFTDMEDLILLDPVHDVDAAQGWPRVATSSE